MLPTFVVGSDAIRLNLLRPNGTATRGSKKAETTYVWASLWWSPPLHPLSRTGEGSIQDSSPLGGEAGRGVSHPDTPAGIQRATPVGWGRTQSHTAGGGYAAPTGFNWACLWAVLPDGTPQERGGARRANNGFPMWPTTNMGWRHTHPAGSRAVCQGDPRMMGGDGFLMPRIAGAYAERYAYRPVQ